MAQRFVDEAAAQLNPVYQQQEQAISSQIPAIQQLYQSLTMGLEAKQAGENQNILESSAARGLTRSSIPVDLQTALGQSMIQAKGELGAKQATDLAGIRTQLGSLNLQKAQGIQSLADTLYSRDLKEREFQMQQQQAERDYQMKVQLARAEASKRSGPSAAETRQQLVSTVASGFSNMSGKDGYVSPETYRRAAREWITSGFGNFTDFNKTFGNYINQRHIADYLTKL